jgi:hypothetical protein
MCVKNRLTCNDSAALMRDESCAWLTLISPLYIKSTIACTSHSLRSLRTITGCLQGVSSKMRWKYGLQIAKHILISLRLSFSHHEKLTSVIAPFEMEFLIIFERAAFCSSALSLFEHKRVLLHIFRTYETALLRIFFACQRRNFANSVRDALNNQRECFFLGTVLVSMIFHVYLEDFMKHMSSRGLFMGSEITLV